VYVRRLALQLRIDLIVEDLTAALQGLGAYEDDDGSDQPALSMAGYPLAQPSGSATANTLRLQPCTSAEVQERITTARQLKQRMRLSTLSYFAERRNYAVLGCASGQGMQLAFLVKYGQTDSNLMPIAQLGSEQLEQLAAYLRVPAEQRCQQPAADSVSVMPAQEAFFPPACFSSGSPMAVYGKGSGRRSCRGSTMP
jgi:NAD+ synthase